MKADLKVDVTEMRVRQTPAERGAPYVRYLAPDEHDLWDTLVEASPQGTVFCRSWWLRATSGDVRVLGYFSGGRLVAGIPLHFKRRLGVKLCTMPRLTPIWGTVMEPISGKREYVNSRELQILRAFAQRLAREGLFSQTFHPTFQNWLPFYWEGFYQTSRITYVLERLDPILIWEEMSHHARTNVRKAQSQGITVTSCDANIVHEVSLKTFRRQGLKHPFSREYLERLFTAAKAHDAGECLAARDQEGRVHAATCLVWDTKKTYYLVAGGDPELRKSGAHALLTWHALQIAAEHSKAFDFEGSVIESVERFFRSFGARQVSYSQIVKLPLWVHKLSRNLIRSLFLKGF